MKFEAHNPKRIVFNAVGVMLLAIPEAPKKAVVTSQAKAPTAAITREVLIPPMWRSLRPDTAAPTKPPNTATILIAEIVPAALPRPWAKSANRKKEINASIFYLSKPGSTAVTKTAVILN